MRITTEKVNKNFTQQQNGILLSTELTDKEKLLHYYYKMRENKEGYCWPSNKRVAKDMGWGLKTVTRAKARLVELGLIDVRRRYDESLGPLSSRIDLRNMIDESVIPTKSVVYTEEGSQLPDTHPEVTSDHTPRVEKGSYNNTLVTIPTPTEIPNEKSEISSVSDVTSIQDLILSFNEELGYDTKHWRRDDVRELENMKEDLEGYDHEYIMSTLDTLFTRFKLGVEKGTIVIDKFRYSYGRMGLGKV